MRSLQGDGRGKALLAVSSGSFLLIGVQMIYPVLLPELRSVFDLDYATAGVLLSLLWIANAVGQLPGGMLADRIGEGATLVASVCLTAIALTAIIFINSLIALFVATVFLGLGLALYGVARYTVMSELYPEKLGTSVGIVQAGADAGQAVLPPIATFLATTYIWQYGFGFTIPFFALVAIGLFVYIPVSSPQSSNTSITLDNIRSVIGEMENQVILYATVLLFVYAIVWVAFTSFYPSYLVEVKDISAPLAAIYFGAFFASGVIVKPLSGAAYDLIGIRFTLFIIAVISGTALVVLPFLEGAVPIAIATVLIALILGSGPIAQSHIIDSLTNDIMGTGLGVIRTGTLIIAAITPVVFGAFADVGIFDVMYLVLGALAGVMALLVMQIPPE